MRSCQICGKKSIIQKSGAHQYGGGWAMRATKKRRIWMVNLHAVKVTYRGVRCTMRLCSKCLRRVKALQPLRHSGAKSGEAGGAIESQLVKTTVAEQSSPIATP